MTYSSTTPVSGKPRPSRGEVFVRRMSAVVLVLILFAATGYTVWRVSLATPADARDTAVCVPQRPAALPVPPGRVLVNVYNATTRTGLAARTAKQLQAYGFKIGKVANDPLRREVRGTAELRGGPSGARQLQVVGAYLDKEAVRRDKRKGADVDLVLGNRFAGLTGPATRVPAETAGCAPDAG